MAAFTTDLLTNTAYGYPNRGNVRRIEPTKLACLHGTANPRTPPATAQQERDYANRCRHWSVPRNTEGRKCPDCGRTVKGPDEGPTASTYADRTGGGVHAVDTLFAPWTNGALRSPKLNVPGVQDVVDAKARGINPNEVYVRTIEFVARYPDFPITDAQIDEAARIIASDSLEHGIVIERSTVSLHSDLDTVNKSNCPVPAAEGEAFVAEVIALANTYRLEREIADLRAEIEVVRTENTELYAALQDRDALLAERDTLLTRWQEYGERVTGHFGAGLAIDRPEPV